MTLDELITTKRAEVLAMVRTLDVGSGLMLLALAGAPMVMRSTDGGFAILRDAAKLSCGGLASVILATGNHVPDGFRMVYAWGDDSAAVFHVPTDGDVSRIRTVAEAFDIQAAT